MAAVSTGMLPSPEPIILYFLSSTTTNMAHRALAALYLLTLTASRTAYGYRSPHAHPHSPDTTSPMYPDRPIRPLPKRTIKERLSPQQAGSIIYPPAPPSTTPLLGFSYSQSDKMNASGQRLTDHGEHTCDCGADHSEPESDDEYMIRGPRLADRGAYGISELGPRMRSSLGPAGTPSKVGYPPQPLSAASSADGYESFENMSNKKKRKIPNHVNGSGGSHASSLDRDMASLEIQHGTAVNGESNIIDSTGGLPTVNGNYNGARAATAPPSGTGMGISGPGRGRNGRPSTRNSAGERKPLGSSANALNAYANGRANRPRRDQNGTAAANKGMVASTNKRRMVLLMHEMSRSRRHHQRRYSIRRRTSSSHTAEGQRERQFAITASPVVISATFACILPENAVYVHLRLRLC